MKGPGVSTAVPSSVSGAGPTEASASTSRSGYSSTPRTADCEKTRGNTFFITIRFSST